MIQLLLNNVRLHLLLAVLLYIFAPHSYSFTYCACLCVLFLMMAYKSVCYEFTTKRYLSFNLLFMLSLFLCTFIIPIFIYPLGYSLFSGYDKYITKCTAMVVLATAMYNLGWQYGYSKIKSKNANIEDVSYSYIIFPPTLVKVLNFLSILAVIYYFIVFRQTIGANIEGNDLGAASYTTILQTILTLALIVNVKSDDSANRSMVNFLKKHLTITLCFAISIILPSIIGDRTMPIYLTSELAATYILLYNRIKLSYIVVGATMVVLFMYTIGQTRKSDSSIRNVGVVESVSSSLTNSTGLEGTFQDFLPASNCLYLFQNWHDSHDGALLYPFKIFILPFSPIPYAPSLLTKLFYDKDDLNSVLSSDLSSDWYRAKVDRLDGGIGTHVVGDIYVSWGIMGVIILFFLFGVFISYGQVLCRENIYWSIAYITYIGQAVYIARGTMYFCYRHFILQIFLLLILCSLSSFRIRNNQYIVR